MLVETDASDYAMTPDGDTHPIVFHSRTFTDTERNYDTHDKELFMSMPATEIGCGGTTECKGKYRNKPGDADAAMNASSTSQRLGAARNSHVGHATHKTTAGVASSRAAAQSLKDYQINEAVFTLRLSTLMYKAPGCVFCNAKYISYCLC